MTYYRKCWRMSRYKSGNEYGSSMTGPQHTLPLMSENTWTMFSPNVGLGGLVQYSDHHVLPMSLLWISLSGGRCLVYETPIDSPEELVARVAEVAGIINDTQSFARRYQLCINVNWHFQQLLWNHPASNPSRTPSEETEKLSDICHITKGFRFISSTNPQSLYTEFFTPCIFKICIWKAESHVLKHYTNFK